MEFDNSSKVKMRVIPKLIEQIPLNLSSKAEKSIEENMDQI